jgi:DNA-binding XRE family transcriptional regulator
MADFRYKPRTKEALDVEDEGLLERISKLSANLWLTKNMAADALGVSRTTFYEFLRRHPEAKDAWDIGRTIGRVDFGQTGYIHARHDPATWRFLAQQDRYLGMKPPKTATAPEPLPDDAPGTTRRLSREELMGRILELARKTTIDVQPEANHGTTGRGIVKRG